MSQLQDSFDGLLGALGQTHALLQQQAARSVDIALVGRNWLFGRHIVECEAGAASRAGLYYREIAQTLFAQSLGGRDAAI